MVIYKELLVLRELHYAIRSHMLPAEGHPTSPHPEGVFYTLLFFLLVLRELHYAIIDEVDSVLVDEARTPLIISSQVNIMLYFQVFRIGQIFNLEETFHLRHAFRRQVNDFKRREQYNCDITYVTNNELGFDYLRDNMVINDYILFIHDKITGFFPFHTHNGIHLGKGFHIRPSFYRCMSFLG